MEDHENRALPQDGLFDALESGGGGFAPAADVPADTSDFDAPAPVGASNGGGDDDIPF